MQGNFQFVGKLLRIERTAREIALAHFQSRHFTFAMVRAAAIRAPCGAVQRDRFHNEFRSPLDNARNDWLQHAEGSAGLLLQGVATDMPWYFRTIWMRITARAKATEARSQSMFVSLEASRS